MTLAVVGAAVTASGPGPLMTAAAAPSVDPRAAVAYQHDPVHDGSSSDPAFKAPFTLAWSKDLGGIIGYPLIVSGRVFVALSTSSGTGNTVEALNLSDGSLIWGPTSIGGTTQSEALAYDAGQVYALNYDGHITAFDATTGTVNWTTALVASGSFSAPPTATGGTLYVAGYAGTGTLYALDETSGSVTWTAPVASVGANSSPAVDGSGIYLSYDCQESYRFNLDGSVNWHNGNSLCTGSSGRTPVLHAGRLYVRHPVTNSAPTVLDAATGAQIATIPAATPAPAITGNFLATESGGVLTMSDVSTGTTLWHTKNNGSVTAPLIVNGYVIEGLGDGTVQARYVQDGTLAWSGKAGSSIAFPNETSATPYTGLAEGDGALVVPAGSLLSVFVPAGDPTVSWISGPSYSTANGTTDTFDFSSGVPNAQYQCTMDGVTSRCTPPYTYTGLQDEVHYFSVSVAYALSGAFSRTFVVDTDPPVVRMRPFHSLLTGRSRSVARWGATDDWSGVQAYQLRFHRAKVGSPFSGWTVLTDTTAQSKRLWIGRRGWELCASVRSGDGFGNWSNWSTPQCVVHR